MVGNSKNFAFVLILSILTTHTPSYSSAARWYSSLDRSALSAQADQIVSTMSTKQKIGQLFIFGFKGKTLTPTLLKTIKNLKPGGVILFGRNISTARQLGNLTYQLQKESLQHAKVPLFIALDQEGGDVTRIRLNPPLPSALSVGMANDPSIARELGVLVGQTLSSLGVNMNLAPVLDISNPYIASFIGTRSFGPNPSRVGEIATSYALGLEEANVLATGKHFPGHGNILSDSHKVLPSKSSTLKSLLSKDMKPYALFGKRLKSSAIMVAHVAFPQLDSSRMPATFSKNIISDILRKKLKYDGLVITDDLEMSATFGIKKIGDRAVQALKAGVNMSMVAWSPKAQALAINGIEKALKNKTISKELVDSTVKRILLTKLRSLSFTKAEKADFPLFRETIRSDYFKGLVDLVLEKNFYSSLNNLKEKSFNWLTTKQKINIFSTRKSFYNSFKKHTSLKTTFIPYSKKSRENFIYHMSRSNRSPGIIYVTGKISANIANSLPSKIKQRTLIVNATNPSFFFKDLKRHEFSGVINIFSHNPNSGKLVAENIIRGK